jgi:hypothetical protein
MATATRRRLPDPSCPLGYTAEDIKAILVSDHRFLEFQKWMYGQTMSICDGLQYDRDKRDYRPTGCYSRPHGAVVFPWDLERFLDGLPIID